MLELDKLIFATDTSQLDTAVKKLGDLQTAVVNLNKPMDKAALASEKLAQAQAKTSKANADATASTAKAELAQVKLEKATATATKTTSSNASVLERQQKILEFMTQGMSKGQASTMAYADATGILDREMQQLRNTLESQRKLLGSEPFDKSLGAIKVMKNELGALRESQRQYNSGVELTVKQAKDLYREKFRLIEAMKIERDRSKEIGDNTVSESQRYTKLKQDLRAINAEYVALAKQRNRLADDASSQEMTRKVNNLSRGLAPQISDVAVSLYGGMSPMTVLMQQGLQVRDLIQSSGVEAGKLNEVLKKTGSDFIGTIGGTFKAIGGLAVGFFQSAGSGAVDFTTKMIGAEAILRSLGKSSDEAAVSVAKFSGVLSTVVGAGLAGTIVFLISLASAFKQVIQEESALTKAINVTGLSMGLSKDAALEYAQSFETIGISQSKAIGVITEMAKQGGFTKEAIQSVTKAAIDLEKYAGVSIEKTVDNFAKFQDKPYEALLKVASATGLVTQAELENVQALEKQGQQAEATADAIRIYGEVTQAQADLSRLSLSGIEILWINIKSAIGGAWEEIKNLARGESFVSTLTTAFNSLWTVISTIGFGIKLFSNSLGGAAAIASALITDGVDAAVRTAKEVGQNMDSMVAGQEQYLKNLWNSGKAQDNVSNGLKLTAQQLEKNVVLAKTQADWEKVTGDLTDKKTKREEGALRIRTLGLALGKSELEIQKNIAAWNEKNKDPKAKKNPVESAYDKAIKTFSKDANAATAAQENYTKAQQDFLNIAASPEWKSYSDKQKQNIVAAAEEAIAREKVVDQIKEQLKAQLELQKVWDKTVKVQTELDIKDFDSLAKSDARLALLDEELADLILQKSIFGELSIEQKKQIEYSKIKRDLTKEIADIELRRSKGDLSSEAAILEKENARIAASKKQQNIDQAIILENLKFEANQRKEIAMAFGEAIATSLFEGGKAGTKKLKSFIESELRNRITLQIQANVETSMKGNTGVNQIVQAGANFGSTLSTQGFGSAVTGGFMDAGAFLFNNGFKDFGNSLLDLGSSLGEFSSVVDSTVGYLGAFNTASEGDYGAAIGEALGTYFGGPIGAAIGKEIGSWLGLTEGGGTAHMGGYGAYSATGGSIKGSTLRGAAGAQFGLADDSIKAASNTMLVGVAQGIVSILDDTANAFGKQAGYYAATSFADDTSDDGAWGALAIKLGDKVLTDWADAQTSRWAPKEFADGEAGLKQYQDALAKSTLDTLNSMGLPEWAAAMLAEIGDNPTMESLTQTISKISAVKDTLTGIGEVIADVFGNATTSSEDAVIALSKVSGGLDKLANNLSGYYSNFYTEEEQLANLRKATSEEFTKLGETLPASREEFRSMVAIAQMLGDSNKVASLLKFQDAINELVPTFEEVTNAAKEARDNQIKLEKEVFDERYSLETRLATVQGNTTALRQRELDKIHPLNQELQKYVWMLEDSAEATKKVNELTKSISESYTKDLEKTITELEKAFEVTDNAMSQLEAAVEAEKKAIDTQVNSLEKTKDTLKNVFETLDEAIKSLYDSVKSTTAKNYNEARAILTRAAGGEKIASATLLPAVSTAVAGVNSRVYSSRFEQDKASILLANELSLIKDSTEAQMTDVEKQLNALETQSKLLDSQLETAKASLDALRGIDSSLISVQEALAKLGVSSLSEKVAREQINAAKEQIAMIEKFSSSQEESLKANLDELIKVAFNTESVVDVLSKLPESIAELMKDSIRTIASDFAKQSGSRMSDAQLQSVVDSVVSGKQTVGSATSEILRSSVTDSNIADFIKSVNLEAADSAQIIAAKAKEFGVSLEDIARSTGYSLDMVGSFLRNGGVSSVDMQALSRNSSNLTATGGVISTATATKVLRNLLNQGDFLGAYNLAKQEGFTLAGVDYLGGYPSGTSASWAAMNGLPAFATGTNYVPSDMIAQIHEGEMIVPKKFNPEAIGNSSGDDKELEMLRYELRAVAQHTAKLSKAIDRLTVGTNEGDALQVRVAV